MASSQSSSPFFPPQAIIEAPPTCANLGQPPIPSAPDVPAVLSLLGGDGPCRCARCGHTRLLRLLDDLEVKYGPPRTPAHAEGTAQ
jgi:hypothetical protein